MFWQYKNPVYFGFIIHMKRTRLCLTYFSVLLQMMPDEVLHTEPMREVKLSLVAVIHRQHIMAVSVIKPAPEQLHMKTPIPPHLLTGSRFILRYNCETCPLPVSSACWPSLKKLIKHIKCLASWRLKDLLSWRCKDLRVSCGLKRIFTCLCSWRAKVRGHGLPLQLSLHKKAGQIGPFTLCPLNLHVSLISSEPYCG